MKVWGSLLILALLAVLAIMPAQAQIVTISGFDSRCISIDGNVTSALDAPGCIDWLAKQSDATLVGIHDGFGNNDPSIFSPGSVYSSGSMLPKQDIVNVYVSNNNFDMYIAEERRSNNGNSAYHLFMTALAPTAPGQPGIVAGQNVVYHLSNDDIEIQICFPKGSDPGGADIQVRQVSGLNGVLNVLAADIWSSGAFKPVPVSVIDGFTVNASPTTALAGARDSKGNPTNIYDIACFAEAAISLGVLNIDPCGAKAYATVITRSSCSLTSDIKDFAGPVLYSFGGPMVSDITKTLGCDNATSFSATVTKGTAPYHIQWFDNDVPFNEETSPGPAPVTCSPSLQMTPGVHNIRVKVTDAGGCPASKDTGDFTVDPILDVTVAGTATCPGVVTWTATPSGGDSNYTYVWKLDGSVVNGTNSAYTYGPKVDCTEHEVCVEITDGRGCKASACKKITQSAITSL